MKKIVDYFKEWRRADIAAQNRGFYEAVAGSFTDDSLVALTARDLMCSECPDYKKINSGLLKTLALTGLLIALPFSMKTQRILTDEQISDTSYEIPRNNKTGISPVYRDTLNIKVPNYDSTRHEKLETNIKKYLEENKK